MVYGEGSHTREPKQIGYWQTAVSWQATTSGIYPSTMSTYVIVFKNKPLIPVYRFESYETRFVWANNVFLFVK